MCTTHPREIAIARCRTALVHVGIRGHVLALHRELGTKVWRTKLPAGAARGAPASLLGEHHRRQQQRSHAAAS